MMQKIFLLSLVAVATISGADAWGDCPQAPENSKYSEACYKATEPPYFVCINMEPDEWVEKALATYPRCCGEDLTQCTCPVKDYWFFKNKIADYCAKVEVCEPDAIATDSSGGDTRFLRGQAEDANE
mmetsp:Transcript_31121/g.45796  ORF Transcript_31121/g.45796 Transcript_31121/m.45796 type:complete len:127 (-) Transcript_31121:62-442(-)